MSLTKKEKWREMRRIGDGNWLSGRLTEPKGLSREGDIYVSENNAEAWKDDLENEVYEITKKKHGFDQDTIYDLEDKYFLHKKKKEKKKKETILKEWREKKELFNKEKSKLEKEKQEFYDTIRKKRYTPDSTLFEAFNPELKDDVLKLDDKPPSKMKYRDTIGKRLFGARLYDKKESELDFKGRKSQNKGVFEGKTDGYKTGGKRKKKTRKKTRKKRGGMRFKKPIFIYKRGDPLAPPPNAYYNPNWMELMGQHIDSQKVRVLLSNLDLRGASAWMKFKAKILEKNFLYYEEKYRQDLNLNNAVFKIVVSNKSQNEKIDNSHSFTRYKIKRSDLIESINNNSDYIPMYKGESLFAITAKKSKLDHKKELNEEEILKFTEAFWKQKSTDPRIGYDLISSGEVLEVLKELRIDYDEQNVYELFTEIDDDYGYGDEIDLDQFLILMKKLTKPKFKEVFLFGDEGVLIGLIEINHLNTRGRDNFYIIPEEKNIVPIIFKSNREEQNRKKKERIEQEKKKETETRRRPRRPRRTVVKKSARKGIATTNKGGRRKKKTRRKRGGLSKELQTALDRNTQLVGKMKKVLKRLDLKKKRSTGGKRRKNLRRKKKRTKRR